MIYRMVSFPMILSDLQDDHSPGKPGKVRELDSGQGKVRENGKSQGKVFRESYNHHLAAVQEKENTAFLRYQSRFYFTVFQQPV